MYRKFFLLFLLFICLTASIRSQTYTMKMRETSGGNFTISIDITNRFIKALRDGNLEFGYDYYGHQVNKESGVIGFSFSRSMQPYMRPNHSGHYFLMRSDAVYCSTDGATKEYKFVPQNMSDYSKIYNSMLNALSQSASLQPSPQSSASSRTFTANGVSFKMIRVDGGTFTMGVTSEQGNDADSDEKPAHQVTLSTYYIGETEVTQELWQAVMGSNPSSFKGNNLPVESVSWNDCQDFIKKINAATGQNFRLPTEAQWEFAARGGTKSNRYKYAGSNTIDNVAWYDSNACDGVGKNSPDYGTHNVATKSPNELGLYDMSGNVWEWCQDWYDSYSSGAQSNPTGPLSGSNRVIRGGSWINIARHCRVSIRNYSTPGYRNYNLGLRLAL